MTTRSVRLDPKSEQILEALARATGMSVTDVLKEGLLALAQQHANDPSHRPYEVFATLDLGPGGEAIARSRGVKKAVRRAIARKLRLG